MRQQILLGIFISCISGCALFETQEAAPVVDLQSMTPVTQGIHTVQRGESLYTIAWQYGRDYRDIAIANNIHPPYKIYPGQKLTLQKPRYNSMGSSSRTLPVGKEAKKATTDPATSLNVSKSLPAQEGHKAPLPNKTIPLIPSTSQLKSADQTLVKEKIEPSNLTSKWSWPVKGKILKAFAVPTSGVINKGIDIAGELGTPIKAASAGKVVYSGAGLRGYGQLVIVKHNDTFLSAYAHNNAILVKEGDVVTQGQIIAKMGKTDADQVKLHFEIRKNGQPINPLDFLPAG